MHTCGTLNCLRHHIDRLRQLGNRKSFSFSQRTSSHFLPSIPHTRPVTPSDNRFIHSLSTTTKSHGHIYSFPLKYGWCNRAQSLGPASGTKSNHREKNNSIFQEIRNKLPPRSMSDCVMNSCIGFCNLLRRSPSFMMKFITKHCDIRGSMRQLWKASSMIKGKRSNSISIHQ